MEITVGRLFENFDEVGEWANVYRAGNRYFTAKPSENGAGWWAGRNDNYDNLILVEIASDEVPAQTVKNWATGELESRPKWF